LGQPLQQRRGELEDNYQSIGEALDAVMQISEQRESVLGGLVESSREAASLAMLEVYNEFLEIRSVAEDEYKQAASRLVGFPEVALQKRANDLVMKARNVFDELDAKAEREQAERKNVAAQQKDLAEQRAAALPLQEALQARIDQAATDLAAKEGAEVSRWTPWIMLAPDVPVRSALVRRPGKRLRPEKRWLVTLTAATNDIVVKEVS
jgi:hypothetical protein